MFCRLFSLLSTRQSALKLRSRTGCVQMGTDFCTTFTEAFRRPNGVNVSTRLNRLLKQCALA